MWIKNPRGDYYNIANAVMGEAFDTPRVGRRVRLKNRTGDEIAVVSEDALAPPAIVLAGPTAGVFISDTGEVSWAAIVAWRIGQSGAEPVLLGDRPQGTLFLPQGDAMFGTGRFAEMYPSLKAASAAVRAAAATNEEEAA
jgi:hypothetical protein